MTNDTIAAIKKDCAKFREGIVLDAELVARIYNRLHATGNVPQALNELSEALSEQDRNVCAFAARTVKRDSDRSQPAFEFFTDGAPLDHPSYEDPSCPYPPWIPVQFARDILACISPESADKFRYTA